MLSGCKPVSFSILSLQIKIIALEKQEVILEDLGIIDYKTAWDYQESLLNRNLEVKMQARKKEIKISDAVINSENLPTITETTKHFFLFCEHPPVYTLGKSGHMQNVLMSRNDMDNNHIEFFHTNRGGDITFHGLQQVVGYPILDLEKIYTDIGRYLRDLEEVIILTLASYGIIAGRSKGETGVWIDAGITGSERKICAMGIRCSRWVTMHGFALNVNTDLSYFDNIIPCGIVNKKVTSIEKELGYKVDFDEVKQRIAANFQDVFPVIFSAALAH